VLIELEKIMRWYLKHYYPLCFEQLNHSVVDKISIPTTTVKYY